VALRRVALLRNAGGGHGSNGGNNGGASVDECSGSPMALGGGGSNDFLPSPAMSHRRSRLASMPRHNPLPSPHIDMLAITPVRNRRGSSDGSKDGDDSSSPDEFEQRRRSRR
jgi:hypothetical protein